MLRKVTPNEMSELFIIFPTFICLLGIACSQKPPYGSSRQVPLEAGARSLHPTLLVLTPPYMLVQASGDLTRPRSLFSEILTNHWPLLFIRQVVSDSSSTQCIAAHQSSLSLTIFWSLPKFMSIESAMPSNHLILCHPLLLLPSIFPNPGAHTWRFWLNGSVCGITQSHVFLKIFQNVYNGHPDLGTTVSIRNHTLKFLHDSGN